MSNSKRNCRRGSTASVDPVKHSFLRGIVACLLTYLLLTLSACKAEDAPAKPPAVGTEVMLTLIAYNYTDNYIDSYSVDGADGGNVFVSNATTGGSKSACCARWIVGQPMPVSVHVRRQSSDCIYTKNVEGQNFEKAKAFYTEKDVNLTQTSALDPKCFETHIYPDRHIEISVTKDYFPPRLKIAEKNNQRPWTKPESHCTPEQLRQGDDE